MIDAVQVVDIIPLRPQLFVSQERIIKFYQPLTTNLNIGRFGQRVMQKYPMRDFIRVTLQRKEFQLNRAL